MITSIEAEKALDKVQNLFMKKNTQQIKNRRILPSSDKGYLYKKIKTNP